MIVSLLLFFVLSPTIQSITIKKYPNTDCSTTDYISDQIIQTKQCVQPAGTDEISSMFECTPDGLLGQTFEKSTDCTGEMIETTMPADTCVVVGKISIFVDCSSAVPSVSVVHVRRMLLILFLTTLTLAMK
jgi:hypothetical protein